MNDPRHLDPTLAAAAAQGPADSALSLDNKAVRSAPRTIETSPATLPTATVSLAAPTLDGGAAALASGLAPGERYEIRGEIARGGMGAILRVWDRTLQRESAIKVLRADLANRDDVLRRFIEEARISGQLQHPGVVPIHEMGHLPDGRLFFAMKLVQGKTLEELLKERADPAAERPRFLKVFEQICETLAFAHSRSVIHRDLKPLNIMVGTYGEVQVMDWGLAKSLQAQADGSAATVTSEVPPTSNDETVHYAGESPAGSSRDGDWQTQAGSVLGTPSYMPPEQARGEIDNLDERADVFGLGAVLCCILTGKPPFSGCSLPDTLRQSAAGNVADAFARLDAFGTDGELINLAKSCLAPDRADRPRNARAVSEVMTHYLGGVQERLRRAEIDRAKFEAERKRRRIQIVLAAVVVLALMLGGAAWFFVQKQADKRRGDVDHAVDVALVKAQELRDRAAAMPAENVAQAEAALVIWQQSRAAVDQAESATATTDASPASLERVRQSKAEIGAGVAKGQRAVEESRRVAKFVASFAEARQESAKDNNIEDPRAAAAKVLEQSFEEYGVDVVGGSVESVVAALEQTRPSLRQPISEALTDWQKWDAKQAEHLRQISDRLDPDPWMKKYRDAARANGVAWKQLAEAEPPKNLTAGQLDLLAAGCVNGYDRSFGLRIYREAAALHPNDFHINYNLALQLCPANGQVPANRSEALTYYRAATAAEPRSIWPRMSFSDVLNCQGEAEAALYEALACTEIDPRFAPGFATQARQFFRLGRYDEALPPARKMLASKFGDWRMYPRILPAFEHFNLTTEVEETARLMSKYGAPSVLVQLLISRCDDRALRELLDELLKNNSRDPVALRDAAQYFLYKSPDLDRAIAGFRRCNEVMPHWLWEYEWLSIALARKGEKAEAALVAAKAAQLGVKLVDFRLANLWLLFHWGLREEGQAALRAMTADSTSEAYAYSDAASILRDHGEFDLALQTARQGMRLHPDWPWATSELVATLIQLRDYAAAEAALRDLAAAHPHFARAVSDMARVQWERGEYDAVIRTLQTLSPDDQRTAASAPWLGLALREKGDFNGALKACKQAIEINPKVSGNYAALAFVQTERGTFGEALATAQRALVMDVADNPIALTGDPVAHAALGWVQLMKGETDKGLATLRHALEVNAQPTAQSSPNLPRWLASNLVHHAGPKAEYAALRRQALDWLHGDLDVWRSRGAMNPGLFGAGQAFGAKALRTDPGFATVRDPKQLAQLPADERKSWEQFWQELDGMDAKGRR